jgi:endonuclease/exonuclease/phosphatase family metal-dependent hydrolase
MLSRSIPDAWCFDKFSHETEQSQIFLQRCKGNAYCMYIHTLQNTIITGDFNASIKEWGGILSDKRGRNLKE